MAIKARARATADLVASGEKEVFVKCLRDGTLSMASFIEAMCLEGRVFSAHAGTVTTAVTYGDGVITVSEPDLMVVVPDGVTFIPLEIVIVMEAYGSQALFEFMAQIGQGSTTAMGTPTNVLTPINVFTGHARKSACSVGDTPASGQATVMTDNVVEFWRGCESKAVTITTADDDSTWQPVSFTWSAKQAGWYPICNGKGGLQVFASCQAGTGFIQLRYLEIPSSWLS